MPFHQPVLVVIPYLPSVNWFVKLRSNPAVAWHAHEITDKKHPRNRCVIATAHGPQTLSVPLERGRNAKEPLSQRKPVAGDKWKREHVHAIRTAYGSAPFFIHYADELFERMTQPYDNLASLNLALIELLLKWLRVDVHAVPPEGAVEEKTNSLVDIRYPQVFEDKTGFQPNCSAIDLLFNRGPESVSILNRAAR